MLAALAALESLPVELYEAATVDGASRWDILKQITLPLIQPYLVALVLLRAIDAFKAFDTIYVLTGGGPGTSTELLTFYAYVAGFRPFNMGFTATISVGNSYHHVHRLPAIPARVSPYRGALT